MTYHMGTYLLISVANYIGYLEGKELIEIEEEEKRGHEESTGGGRSRRRPEGH